MNDPEVLKRLLEEARQEVENWPDWMKNQEPVPGISTPQVSCGDEDEQGAEDERLSA